MKLMVCDCSEEEVLPNFLPYFSRNVIDLSMKILFFHMSRHQFLSLVTIFTSSHFAPVPSRAFLTFSVQFFFSYTVSS